MSESLGCVSGQRCRSCGMPIDDGVYCRHCVDENGDLQVFEERFERMVQFVLHQGRAESRAEAEASTLRYMATMPAWKDHPRVRAAGS